jgi:hypothetical protein
MVDMMLCLSRGTVTIDQRETASKGARPLLVRCRHPALTPGPHARRCGLSDPCDRQARADTGLSETAARSQTGSRNRTAGSAVDDASTGGRRSGAWGPEGPLEEVGDAAAAFEEQVGSHRGGLHGPRSEPFLLRPAGFPVSGEDLIGAGAVRLLRS